MKQTEGQDLLNSWLMEFTLGYGVPMNFQFTYFADQPHRHYHTWAHVEDLAEQIARHIKGREGYEFETKCLLLAAMYHDVVYDPASSYNEEKSAALFNEQYGDYDLKVKPMVTQMILDTKTHEATEPLSQIFCEMDLDILSRPLSEQMVFEQQIFKEYQKHDYTAYKVGRIKVLEDLQESNPHIDLSPLIEYVRGRVPKIGFYPGSFNPFHKGHLNILQKAERLFDKVIIGHGINPEKANKDSEHPALPEVLRYHQVIQYSEMLHKLVSGLGYPVTVIRGLRNGTDLQYELNQYRFIQELSKDKVDIVSIFCDAKYEHISSSAIRHLMKYEQEADYLL